jgi:hypothetical protein
MASYKDAASLVVLEAKPGPDRRAKGIEYWGSDLDNCRTSRIEPRGIGCR